MRDNREDLFSVPVWGFMLNDQKYQSRDYIDALEQLEKDSPGVSLSNAGGYQTHDNLHTLPVFRELVTYLQTIGARCYTDASGDPCGAIITELWGNINYKHSVNFAHTHGEALSGVFYLQVPKDSGKLVLCNPSVRSDGRALRKINYPIVPQDLACIIFPSWLEHYVEPNMSNDKRISLAFNMKITKYDEGYSL